MEGKREREKSSGRMGERSSFDVTPLVHPPIPVINVIFESINSTRRFQNSQDSFAIVEIPPTFGPFLGFFSFPPHIRNYYIPWQYFITPSP